MCPEETGDYVQNRTDGCPEGTSGFAFWTCDSDSGVFKPPQVDNIVYITVKYLFLQPDRTHCQSDWLKHVIEMVNY